MPPVVLLIIAIVVISAVVGAIAQFLNKLNEASAPPPRRLPRPERDPSRQPDKEMDRFLAEIDRLRRKNAEGAEPMAGRPPVKPPAALPTPRPAKPVLVGRGPRSEKVKKPRIVAELAEPQARRRVDSGAMAAPPAPVAPGTLSPEGGAKTEILPVASVVSSASSTGAPAATRVTRLPQRSRPSPKTDFAQNLTGLLNSSQGTAMAVILQEILGPPKSKR
jgi:hypothetical protein